METGSISLYGRNKKFRGLALTLRMTAAFLMGFILLGGVAWAGIGWISVIRSDQLKDECNRLEYALMLYGDAHRIVKPGSIHLDEDGNLQYSKVRSYPESQSALKELHDKGYLSRDVKFEDFQRKSDGSKSTSVTFYKVSGDKTAYKIEVILSSGEKYKTPGSSDSL